MTKTFPLKLEALLDLLRRYGAVFRHAWGVRRALDPQPRLPHEAQFLPAALELQETPVSPAPKMAMWLLIAFALIALVWALFGHVDMVATAKGKIVPNDRSKVLGPVETSRVVAIHVSDGQRVKAGDLLIELDPTAAAADQSRLGSDRRTARFQAARARAMLAAIASGKPPAMEAIAEASPSETGKEQSMLEGQYGEYRTRLARIDAERSRQEAELRSVGEVIRKLEQTVPIAKRRAEDYKNLVDKSFISQHGYLEKEQSRIELEADLATQRSRATELAAALHENAAQRTALVAETRRILLDSLNDAEQKVAQLSQELVKAENRGALTRLVAPVDGTVQQLSAHTVGGVAAEAQPILTVVPADNALEVEAFLENKDIGFVDQGHEAEVKVETFPYTKYGTLHATVTHVSHDAINDEKRGLIYSARVKLDKATLQVEEKRVNLSPGMAVTVEIKTGRRRVIEYFLSPLLQYKDESLRER
ncbi:MAG: HlyD family type I secretion periplasmic adaptor subunit [Rhodocyclaceae bacterium]|nr:HlyD family type I secretion periplasmic adaptor subunit [Rhodocyclaceae bacterium]